jgi:CubicO group peptidase (beta-lactamase class C family)
MTLVEKGKLKLDHTIDEFLPEYEFSKDITIRHLLNHTSGIMDYSGEILVPNAIEQYERKLERKLKSSYEINEFINSLCRAYTFKECLDLVKGRPLHFTPGEGTAYSNTNYHFLSDIIERITDMSFNEYLISNIFTVLGMNNSHANGLYADAKGYVKDEFGNMLNCGGHGMLSGDSGVVSNVKDMECWCSAILNCSLLRQESWNQCLSIVNERFGFGFEKFNDWIGHNGGMPGISNRERLHLQSKTAIIMLSNKVNSYPNTINEIMKNIIL